MLEIINKGYEAMKSGGNPNTHMAISEQCAEEQTRMERILIKKYALTPRENSQFNISTEEGKRSDLLSQVSSMCHSK